MITMGVEQYTKDAWGRLDEKRGGARWDAKSEGRHVARVNPGAAGGIP
jgi:hypothetical protein